MNICVYGAASTEINSEYYDRSEEFAKKLVARGHNMVFGGGTRGIMGAVARGATASGGSVVGVSPKFFDHDGILYDKCDELILTDTIRERKRVMAEHADAFAVMPGGVGTLDEMFEMFSLKQLRTHKKPIALYNIRGYYDGLIEFIKTAVSEKFMEPACLDMVVAFSDADKLLEYLENNAK